MRCRIIPPNIKKQMGKMINTRLTRLSCNETVFNETKEEYQKALDDAQYNYQLKYTEPTENSSRKKNRSRKISWFNPPYNANVQTNIGKITLNLISKHLSLFVFNFC